MEKKKQYTVKMISGIEGKSLYINDRRVAGTKISGGETVVKTWKINVNDLIKSIPEIKELLQYILVECQKFPEDSVVDIANEAFFNIGIDLAADWYNDKSGLIVVKDNNVCYTKEIKRKQR